MRFLKNWIKAAVMVAAICCLCGCYSASGGNTEAAQPELLTPQITFTQADQTVHGAAPVHIALEQMGALCRITDPGCYRLTGQMTGSVKIDAQDQIIHIILDGVTVRSFSGPALEVVSAGKVILSLVEGSENTFQDSGAYDRNTEADACIYSACDLTINGSGKLNVHGYYKDAIHTKDVLKILGGSCFAESKRDGLHGNDGIAINGTTLTVQSERHGLHSTKIGKTGKGNVELREITGSVIGGQYGIDCAADLYMDGCELYVMGVYDKYYAAGTSRIEEGGGVHG